MRCMGKSNGHDFPSLIRPPTPPPLCLLFTLDPAGSEATSVRLRVEEVPTLLPPGETPPKSAVAMVTKLVFTRITVGHVTDGALQHTAVVLWTIQNTAQSESLARSMPDTS